MILGEIIKNFRTEHEMSMDIFAKKSGLTKGYISMLEKNEHPKSKKPIIPTDETLKKVAKGMDTDLDFILNLLDPDQEIQINIPSAKLADSKPLHITEKVIQLDKELKEPRHSAWISHGERLLEEQKKEEQGTDVEETMELYSVLTTTSLAAGIGYAFDDYDQETVYVGNRPPRHDLASFISGDSMEPKYHNGDIVYLVDKGFSSYSGEICAVAVNNKTYLKRVYTEKGQLRLVSINPKYDDIYIDFPPTDGHIRIYSVVGTDSVVEN